MNPPHHHHHRPHDEEEAVIDAETREDIALEEEEVSAHALKDTLRTLRTELVACKQQRDENLAGWQRAKADLVNFRRSVEEDRARDLTRARGSVIRSLIPALDSFASAMEAESWKSVETGWREGIERTVQQITKALHELGLERFGRDGEAFDPTLHECVSVAPAHEPSKDHTLAHVLQAGYRVQDEVIRPAKVVVAQYADAPPAGTANP